MVYHSHEYAGPKDMESMLGLMSEAWLSDGSHNLYHVGDVYWRLGTQRVEPPSYPCTDICLWATPAGETVGFAWLEDPIPATFGRAAFQEFSSSGSRPSDAAEVERRTEIHENVRRLSGIVPTGRKSPDKTAQRRISHSSARDRSQSSLNQL